MHNTPVQGIRVLRSKASFSFQISHDLTGSFLLNVPLVFYNHSRYLRQRNNLMHRRHKDKD